MRPGTTERTNKAVATVIAATAVEGKEDGTCFCRFLFFSLVSVLLEERLPPPFPPKAKEAISSQEEEEEDAEDEEEDEEDEDI